MVAINIGQEKILIAGREFTQAEIDETLELIRMFPNLSYTELAMTICENLDWKTPTDKNKVDSCRLFLEKLRKMGVAVPEIKKSRPHKKKAIRITSRTDPQPELYGTASDWEPLSLLPVRGKEQMQLWNEYVERYHILKYKRPFGAHQRYFIVSEANSRKQYLGCLLFAASAWALADRDQWIGWTEADRSQRLNLVVNNTRFLIFPWVKIKYLASKALSLAAKRIPDDWQERYGYRPVLLETFVDKELYKGTCYRAANWINIGTTAGRGRMDRYSEYLSSEKLIFMYPLVPDFRDYLHLEED